jgi:hypothetical protein
MQEFSEITSTLPPDDQPLVEPLAGFLLSFVQALLKTGYYQPDHPGATAAKEGLYSDFVAISKGARELSFVAKEGRPESDILIHGVLTEPILMRKLLTHAMSGLFIPKFLQYFERRHLVSFCLKPKITHEEFDGFIDLMSEHPTATSRMREMIQLMTEQLVARQIVNVSTIYQEEMIAEDRDLHWITRIVLTRLGKDLHVTPLYRHLTPDDLNAVKQQLFVDVLRPISSPDVLKEVIVNCDLMRLPKGEALADIESRVAGSIRPDRLLPTITACANDLKRLQSSPDAARSEAETLHYQRLKTAIKLLTPNLWNATEQLSSDIIETLLQEHILSIGDLPAGLRGEILLRQQTRNYLSDPSRHLQPLRDGWVDEPAQFLISILPGLLDQHEASALREAVHVLWTAWKRSNPGTTTSGRPDRAFLSSVGAERMATALVTHLQDTTLRHREELLPVVELFGRLLIDPLISIIEHEDIWVRRSACRILAGLGPAVIPPLLSATEARWDSWYFVRNAVMILGDVSLSDETVLILLRRCQSHPHPRVQEETMTSYGKLKSPEAEPYLIEALGKNDPVLAGRAVLALGSLHTTHERALQFLRETLRRKAKDEIEADHRIQIHACMALESILSAHPALAESFGPLLREALAKEKPLLSSFTGQKYHQKSPDVRQAIEKLLLRITHAGKS